MATDKQKKSPIPNSTLLREAEPIVSEGNVYRLPTSLTSMLGREREIKSLIEISGRVDIHLITIVGPPGVGKTHLALYVAGQVERTFANGAVFVDLTPVKQVELVLPAIATALGTHLTHHI